MKIKNLFFIFPALFFLLFFPQWIIKFLTLFFLIINILSYFYSRILYENIDVCRKRSIIRSYKNHNVEIELTLKNKSFLPANYLLISDSTSLLTLKESGNFLTKAGGNEKINLAYKVNAHKRGAFIIGPIRITSGDPLGFYTWTKTADSFCEVIIYPDIYKFFFNVREGIPAGIIKSMNKIYEDTSVYRSIREYVNGDDLKRINWKVSAKMNRLHTTEYDNTLNSPVLVMLNLNLNDYPLRYRHSHCETAIEIAGSMIYYFINRKQHAGLISGGRLNGKEVFFDVKSGHNHAVMMLEALAKISPADTGGNFISLINASNMRIPNRTRVILVTPKITGDDLVYIYRFKKENLIFNVFLIEEEKTAAVSGSGRNLGIDVFHCRLEERKIIYEKTTV